MNTNDQNFINENFFVITSTNLTNIKSKLYGYALVNEKFYIHTNDLLEELPNDSYGCYVQILVQNQHIRILQDYYGMYGLYLYQKDGEFAISNSFYYLVEYLSRHLREMTFDISYAKSFLAQSNSILSFGQTMVKEITELPKNRVVDINISSKEILLERIFQPIEDLPLNTKQAIELLDKWHQRWQRLFRSLANEKAYLHFGISGGKDSRAALGVLFNEGRKIEEADGLYFFSATDKNHQEDFRITKELGKILGIEINSDAQRRRIDSNRRVMSSSLNFYSSILAKGGFHKELLFTNAYYKKPLYRIAGMVDSILRDYWNMPVNQFIEKEARNHPFNTIDCYTDLKKMLLTSYEKIEENIGHISSARYFYNQIRVRNHYGRAIVEAFLGNQIFLNPLMDPALLRIQQKVGDNDYDLLYEVIFQRYLQKKGTVLNVPFDSNRIVINETKRIAGEINTAFPVLSKNPDEPKMRIQVIDARKYQPVDEVQDKLPKELLISLAYKEELKSVICRIFGSEIYNKSIRFFERDPYYGQRAIAALVEIYLIYKNVICTSVVDEINSYASCATLPVLNGNNHGEFLEYRNNGFLKKIFHFLSTCRIDIRNEGKSTNYVELVKTNDSQIFVEYPNWGKTQTGQTRVFQSAKPDFLMKLLVHGNGKVKCIFKPPYLRDQEHHVMPIRIDFTQIRVIDENTNSVLKDEKNIFVSQSWFYESSFNCTDGQVLRIEVKILPSIYDENELLKIIHLMYDLRITAFTFWEKGVQIAPEVFSNSAIM